MISYPTDRKRSGYFARFTKALFKANAAARIGPDSVLLAILIASSEDGLHYSRAPKFWRSQLMEALGVGSPNTFAKLRTEAVKAGLVHYEEGSRTQQPTYWTLVPDWLFPHMPRAQKMSASTSTSSKNERVESPRAQKLSATRSKTERLLEPIYTHKEKESEVSDLAPPLLDGKKQSPLRLKQKYTSADMDAAKHLWARIVEVAGKNQRHPDFEKWADDIRKIRELDKHSPEEIRSMIDVAHGDEFWRTNILSPGKLREQWLKLSVLSHSRSARIDPSHILWKKKAVHSA